MKYPLLLFLLLSFCVLNCQSPQDSKLLIATAANVQFAMEHLSNDFEVQTGIPVEIILGSSGKLTAQIMQGAPYDLFVSANMLYPTQLHEAGKTTAAPEVYALGQLVAWSMTGAWEVDENPLSGPHIKKIAIANPKTAPYGQAALETLQHFGIFEAVKDRLVYGESISQTNQFIISQTADLGFTAKSVVLSEQLKGKGKWMAIAQEHYSPIEQGVVVIKNKKGQHKAAERFQKFLFSPIAQTILTQYGYELPQPPPRD